MKTQHNSGCRTYGHCCEVVDNLESRNADLRVALELAGHTAVCSNDSELTPTAKEGRGLCERCAAIAAVPEALSPGCTDSCPDGSDCPCYIAGIEAPREPLR